MPGNAFEFYRSYGPLQLHGKENRRVAGSSGRARRTISSRLRPRVLHNFCACRPGGFHWLTKCRPQRGYFRKIQVSAWGVASRHRLVSVHTSPCAKTLHRPRFGIVEYCNVICLFSAGSVSLEDDTRRNRSPRYCEESLADVAHDAGLMLRPRSALQLIAGKPLTSFKLLISPLSLRADDCSHRRTSVPLTRAICSCYVEEDA